MSSFETALYSMDAMVNMSRRVAQFKVLEPGWTNEGLQEKMGRVG